MAKRIVIDHENNAEEWWDAAHESTDAPAPIRFLLETDADSVRVNDDEADDVLAWASQLTGWDDGPEYARHPLLVQDA